ncbi:rRNA maturation RNase YbeY [bacterium]|nr:rRNA maturation RNase YbeY [candidate division CSSED10-310 bacterium]
MTVLIHNRQRTYSVHLDRLEALLHDILERLGQRNGELSLLLVNDRAMRAYNRRYLGGSGATDVISFPQYSGDIGAIATAIDMDMQQGREILLGDVIISIETLWKRTGNDCERFSRDLAETSVHAVLHLLGYDHATPLEETQMKARSATLMGKLAIPDLTGKGGGR